MSRLKSLLSSSSSKVEALRVVVSRIRYSKSIDEVPDSLAKVLDLYDRAPLDVNFRADIHSILSGGIHVAESMLDPAFDSNQAIAMVSEQITTLSRILNYLAQRPTRIGYSILSVSSGTLLGQFSSEAEANQHLADLKSLNHATNAIVVPVKIVSQFSVRPTTQEPLPEGFPSILSSTPVSPSELDDMIYHPESSQPDDPARAAGLDFIPEAPPSVTHQPKSTTPFEPSNPKPKT